MTSHKSRYADMAATIRLRILVTRDWIENAQNAKGRDRRPDYWFGEMQGVIASMIVIRDELEFIEANAAAYEAWKASIPTKSKGEAA